MAKILLVSILCIGVSAHAGLFNQLESWESARNQEIAKQNEASRSAYAESVTAAYLLKKLNMPPGTSVTNEGEHRQSIGYGTEYNIGGVWGCVVFPPNGLGLQISCLSTNGARTGFARGPIDHASDNWYRAQHPEYYSHAHLKKVRSAK